MAGTFLDSWKLANFVDATVTPNATDFRRRVQQAMVKSASLIAGEAQQSLTLQQWQKRAVLATNILGTHVGSDPSQAKAGSEVWLDTFANAVANNPTITESSTDGDIEFTVNSVWDDIAGVTGQDLT